MLIWRRVEEPGEVGRKADLRDNDRPIGGGRQGFAEHSRCALGRATGKQVVRKAKTIAVFLTSQGEIATLFDDASLADDADGDVSTAVKGVDRINKGRCQIVID